MSTLASRFLEHWPLPAWQNRTVLVAVSGGPDSVALLRLLIDAWKVAPETEPPQGKLLVLHYNHRLRGEASEEDTRFVQKLAVSLGLAFHTEEAPRDWQAKLVPGQGVEAAARRLRYAFFERVARQTQARYLVTGHHRDDQVETVLHRILRGTGVAGLAGIAAARQWLPGVGLVRPLLPFGRAEILQYLEEIDQPFRYDTTNETTRYTRNKIRNQVLPQLREMFGPQVDQSLWRLSQQATECQEVIADLVEQLRDAAVTVTPQGVQFSVCRLSGVRPYLIRELFVAEWSRQNWPRQEMTRLHWQLLSDMIVREDGPSSKMLPGAIHAQREADWLSLQVTQATQEKERETS